MSSNFNYEEWKLMNSMPFTYCIGQLLGILKGLSVILGIVFVCLYACDKIDWSLWFVTMPFWYAIPVLFITLILDGIRAIIRKKTKKKW